MKNIADKMSILLFIFSVVFVSFGYGIAAHKYNLFPYSVFLDAKKTIDQMGERDHYLHPIRYKDKNPGVNIVDESSVFPGVTFLTSFWPTPDWQPGAELIDIDGNKLHHWKIDPQALWGSSPWNYIHGSYLFPNGDILINIEYQGLTRIDACGNVKWKLDYRTHHSVYRDEHGDFWVSGIKTIQPGDTRAAEFPHLVPPFEEEFAVKVSPEGEILKEVSILKALFDGGYKYLLWKFRSVTGDVIHINDVEALDSEQSKDHPMFAEGDLLISMKHINTVLVLDQSGKIKWIDSHHFNRQHDPDFEKDGWIVVYDNREDDTETGDQLGGSSITAINPTSGQAKFIYPGNESQFFYSNAGGKHQLFPNGNRLITEVRAGRVFEIDSSGRVVWEWLQKPYDAELIPEVMEGTRYSISAQDVASWQCNG